MSKAEIITYGCAMNQADSEMMAGLLGKQGIKVGEKGEVVIVNTCTVKAPTERKVLKKLEELEKEGKKVIVTGCLPLVTPEVAEKFEKFSFLGTNVCDIVEAVKKIEKGERFVKISRKKENLLPKVRKNPFIEIIPIAQGCISKCAYCCVKLARGKLNSVPQEKIVSQVKSALSEGVKEMWLTAQDTGCYGLDRGEDLPSLLREVSQIPGNFKVRVGMMNPNHALRFLPELISAYKGEKLYKFLHLPVQSGNDEVLEKMNRKYEVEALKKIVEEFRKEIPKITLSTDVILGFPGETKKQFQDSLDLIQEIKPDVLNISRYWDRPRTKAKEMNGFPSRITKDRSREMNKIFQKIGKEQNEKKWLGWEGKVLVSQKGKPGSYKGRNFAYRPVVIKSEKNLLGKWFKLKIEKVTYYDLRGEVV